MKWIIFFLLSSVISGCIPSESTQAAKRTGAIVGCVHDLTSGSDNLVSNASVAVQNTELGAVTGIDGKFILLNVPSGNYDVSASKIYLSRKTIVGVKVAPDSVTILNIVTHNAAIEDPLPSNWQEMEKKIVPIKQILSADNKYIFDCSAK